MYPALSQHDINLDIVYKLSEADLKAIGLTLGARKRLMRAIATRSTEHSAPEGTSPSTRNAPSFSTRSINDTNPERRQLTVLFCDLVGSTELSLQLDLEDLRDVLLYYQTTVSDLCEASRGFIARYMGDSVLVYFGYPVAMEDDALSAVQAAQQILDAFQNSPRFVEAGFRVRIGIATGLVLAGEIVGSGASEEHTVLGQTPNLAARLQGVAGPNQMVVDEQTWRLIRRRYSANTLDDLNLKGFDNYVTAYEIPLQQPRSQFRQPEDNKLIGRRQELHTLQLAWQTACQGQRQFVLMHGEPGIGKSRLIREFGNILESDSENGKPSHCVQWTCSPHWSNSAFFTVIQYLQDICGFSTNDPQTLKHKQIIDAADVLSLSTEEADRLSRLLSIVESPSDSAATTPGERREALINLLIKIFSRLDRQYPTVLVIEDIHAIDPSTLEIVQALMARSDESAFLLLMTCRPEFDTAVFSDFKIRQLQLNPLANEDCSELISELGQLPRALAQEILRKADGVPLYVEEITHALFDAAKQSVTASSSTGGIPSTLQSLLLAKLDRLGPARELAQLASVVGDEVNGDLLRRLSDKSSQTLQHELQSLLTAGVLVDAVGTTKNQYRFRQSLFQEVAYQTLLRDDKKRLHLKVGEAIRDSHPELASTQPERVAWHFTAAQSPEQAITFWLQSATRASSLSANDECFSHINAARSLLESLNNNADREALELELNIVHASVLRGTAGPASDLIAGLYERSLVLCESTGQHDKQVAPLNGLYVYNLLRTRYTQATDYANRLLQLANKTGDTTSRMVGHRALGAVNFNSGNLAQASQHLQESRRLYNPDLHGTSAATIGADHLQVATSFYCVTLCVQGHPETALSLHLKELKRAKNLAHAHNTAQLLVFLTFHSSMSARPETAHYCQQLYEISEQYNFPMMLASAQFFEGLLKLHTCDSKTAYEQMKAAVELYQSTGTLNYLPYFKMRTAEACLALGEYAEAKIYLAESQSNLESTAEYWCRAEQFRLWGEYEKLANNNKESALSHFDHAVKDAKGRGAMLWLLLALQSKLAAGETAESKTITESQLTNLLITCPELRGTYREISLLE